RRLRAKLGDLESVIGTVRNVGYRLNIYEEDEIERGVEAFHS
ncbi:MAG: response regulator transcription factor, partial [Cryobacterium sp.]|nr:response regulator transcription factor [Cryobacterium sp.]